MTVDETGMGGPNWSFRTTIWSDILGAADPSDAQCHEKLGRLCQTYWKPVYAYIRLGWHKSVEEAKDLAQAFFAHLLEKDYLSRLRPERGSFRGYIKRALHHFLVNAKQAESARRAGTQLLSLDAYPAELERLGVASDETPDRAYDREWFWSLFEAAVETLRDELQRDGKTLYFEVFRAYCLDPACGLRSSLLDDSPSESPTYGDVAQRLGIQESDVRNYLSHCRRLIRRIVWERIRDTVATDADVEVELREVTDL